MRSLPNFWVHASCDHAVVTRMLPAGLRKTRMRSYWLVHRDAREGEDYQLDRLLPFWHLTNEQDWEICKWQQRGVESVAFVPGPLSVRMEYNVDAFIRWYLQALRTAGPIATPRPAWGLENCADRRQDRKIALPREYCRDRNRPLPTPTSAEETLGFQAEVRQLLQLMIHSLYSNREIFLRELISNASDACDKLRFEALHNEALFEDDSELRIRIDYDPAARTLTVADNGVGMSRDEVIANLGTIAKSGTQGVLLAADRRPAEGRPPHRPVRRRLLFVVHRRRQGDGAHPARRRRRRAGRALGVGRRRRIRRRDGGEADARHRGHAASREGQDDLLVGLQAALDHPQVLRPHRPADPDAEGGVEGRQEAEGRRGRDGQPGVRPVGASEGRNHATSSTRSSTSTSATTSSDPLAWTHARVEGRQEYTQLLYIPARAPFDLWDRDARHGIKLYVRRVFIMDDAEQLLPAYLRFVRGVVDSNDLPLNVSREILQESKDIEAIRGGCTQAVLALLEELAANEQGEVREVLGRVRPRVEGRRRRGFRQQGDASPGCCASRRRTRTPPSRPCRSPTTSAG